MGINLKMDVELKIFDGLPNMFSFTKNLEGAGETLVGFMANANGSIANTGHPTCEW